MLKQRSLFSSSYPLITFLSHLSSSSCRSGRCFSPPSSSSPPVPKKIPFKASAHGRTWEDPYHWMSNTEDPDLSEYLLQENSYAEAFMADTLSLQCKLFEEMRSRAPSKVCTPPEHWGPWLYYQYVPEGKEYPVLCRRWDSNVGLVQSFTNFIRGFARDEILLDWNEVAEQYGYVHIGTCRISPNHKFLAYTVDVTGGESFLLQIKDLTTGCIIPQSRAANVVSLAWARDSRHLLYTVSDENQRPYRVLCLKLGSDALDSLLYTENDSGCCVDITNTKDGRFITVNCNSRTSSEVLVIDADRPLGGLQCVRKRVAGVQYFLEHHHNFFYVLTNAFSEDLGFVTTADYHLARFRNGNISSAGWQDIILSSDDIIYEDMDIFNGYLVLFIRRRGLPMVCSINMPIGINCKYPMYIEDLNPWYFPMPSESCSVVPGSNHDFMAHCYRVVLSSPVVPDIVVEYNMLNRSFKVVHQEEAIAVANDIELTSPVSNCIKFSDTHNLCEKDFHYGSLSKLYTCERKVVTSHDGIVVPLTIMYSRKAKDSGQNYGLLQGYGAYGEVLDKSWCEARFSLLDDGWVIAFADVRGGGGGGKSWHQAGTRSQKMNSMLDFIACGQFLINEGYVRNDRLCAIGTSAGGLLVGSVINMFHDLFSAAILKVPFLDTSNTLLNPNLPLSILDYEEFGDPRVQEEFQYMQSYSPYDNIEKGVCLPSLLVTTSFHDSRVGVWEAAKWVAKARDLTCPHCSRSIILKVNLKGGHFGEGGQFGHYKEAAFEYAFLFKVMGMLDKKKTIS